MPSASPCRMPTLSQPCNTGCRQDLLTPRHVTPSYLAFLGRICPEKRPDRAIRIARRAGIPLKIAAKVDRVDEAYFRDSIQPMIDGRDVELIGEINDAEKPDFLSGADRAPGADRLAGAVRPGDDRGDGLRHAGDRIQSWLGAGNRRAWRHRADRGKTRRRRSRPPAASTAVARQRAPQLRAEVHRAADGRGLLGVVSPPGCPGASDTARGSVGWSFPGALAPASAAAPRPLERSREPRQASAFLRATHWRGGLGQTSLNVAGQIVQTPQHALEALRRSAPRRWMACCCRARRAAPTLPGTW